MAQIRGTAGYHLGNPNPFGGSKSDAADPSPLDAIREQTSKIEDVLDTVSEPIKPYVYPYFRLHPCVRLPHRIYELSLHNCIVKNSSWSPTNKSFCYRYLPAIGRFLIVVTFLEDALRIITQWNDQLVYLNSYRHSMFDEESII